MNFTQTEVFRKQNVKIKNLLPKIGIENVRKEIIAGLNATQPYISSKYFYNETGSALFEKITDLPEYYPTRTEKGILEKVASGLMNRNGFFEIIELGSGDCSKISILLNAIDQNNLGNVKYVPVDFSKSAIKKSTQQLLASFPELNINGYVADFIHQMDQIPHSEKSRLICFLGSTIGNFTEDASNEIMQNLSIGLLKDDSLLVGFDMVKSEDLLHAAYNDSQGVTNVFNLNILNVVNDILISDFNPDNFSHCAFYNKKESKVEMHLIAKRDCEITSPYMQNALKISKGDHIHTENSYKYTLESIQKLAWNSGLIIRNFFTDRNKWFYLVEFKIQ